MTWPRYLASTWPWKMRRPRPSALVPSPLRLMSLGALQDKWGGASRRSGRRRKSATPYLPGRRPCPRALLDPRARARLKVRPETQLHPDEKRIAAPRQSHYGGSTMVSPQMMCRGWTHSRECALMMRSRRASLAKSLEVLQFRLGCAEGNFVAVSFAVRRNRASAFALASARLGGASQPYDA